MRLPAQQRFSEQRWDEFIEEQDQLSSSTDPTPTYRIERNDCFGGDLPRTPDIRYSGIHCGGSFLSARRIEGELNERNELIRRLVFG